MPRVSERHYLASSTVLILKYSRCLGREKKKLIPTELEENAALQLFLAAFLHAMHIHLCLWGSIAIKLVLFIQSCECDGAVQYRCLLD